MTVTEFILVVLAIELAVIVNQLTQIFRAVGG